MAEESTDGATRLRKSGVGVVVGGVLLAVSATVLPFALGAALVLAIGAVGLAYADALDVTQGAVGVAAVGGIALLEALPGVGLGLEPLSIAVIAVAFGVFDVLAGLVLGRVQPASGE